MEERLDSAAVISLIKAVAQDIVAQSAHLTELDAAAGDGDLGVTVTVGMKSVEEGLRDLEDKDIGTILMRSGMNFNRAAASTFGTIFSMAIMKAGGAVAKKNEITPEDCSAMMEAAEKGVADIGKAKVGDKTMLDALVPMRGAFQEAVTAGEGLGASLAKAYREAEQAVEKTKNMKPAVGRSRWLGERSIGHPDPGAVAIVLMLRSLIANLKKMGD